MKASPVSRTNHWLRGRFNLTIGTIPFWLIGMFVTVAWIAPFVWMVSTSLKPASQIMTADIEWLPREITIQSCAGCSTVALLPAPRPYSVYWLVPWPAMPLQGCTFLGETCCSD